MSPQIIFGLHLILGYVAWLLCFGVYILPRLKSMDLVAAQRAIATLHSFRFFGLVFILPGVVGPNLPAGFATFAAYWDFATGVLAMLALLTVRIRPLFWLFVVAFNLVGIGRPHPRLLPRHPGRPSCACGAVGRHLRDSDHLRALADDHARRRILFAAASSAQGGSSPRRRCRGILESDESRVDCRLLEVIPKRGWRKLAGLVPGSRLAGSDLRTHQRFWPDYGQFGSDPLAHPNQMTSDITQPFALFHRSRVTHIVITLTSVYLPDNIAYDHRTNPSGRTYAPSPDAFSCRPGASGFRPAFNCRSNASSFHRDPDTSLRHPVVIPNPVASFANGGEGSAFSYSEI